MLKIRAASLLGDAAFSCAETGGNAEKSSINDAFFRNPCYNSGRV
jgi:hypothetical protein